MAHHTGHITIVQETRFWLTDTRGVAHHFTLAAHPTLPPHHTLHSLTSTLTPVTVRYQQDQQTLTLIAQEITLK